MPQGGVDWLPMRNRGNVRILPDIGTVGLSLVLCLGDPEADALPGLLNAANSMAPLTD